MPSQPVIGPPSPPVRPAATGANSPTMVTVQWYRFAPGAHASRIAHRAPDWGSNHQFGAWAYSLPSDWRVGCVPSHCRPRSTRARSRSPSAQLSDTSRVTFRSQGPRGIGTEARSFIRASREAPPPPRSPTKRRRGGCANPHKAAAANEIGDPDRRKPCSAFASSPHGNRIPVRC